LQVAGAAMTFGAAIAVSPPVAIRFGQRLRSNDSSTFQEVSSNSPVVMHAVESVLGRMVNSSATKVVAVKVLLCSSLCLLHRLHFRLKLSVHDKVNEVACFSLNSRKSVSLD
jgi:hypothetical protein